MGMIAMKIKHLRGIIVDILSTYYAAIMYLLVDAKEHSCKAN